MNRAQRGLSSEHLSSPEVSSHSRVLRLLTLSAFFSALFSIIVSGCLTIREGDMRSICRSNIDCTIEEMSCLPLYPGERLSDYCARASCPNDEGFERFSDQYRMVSVCDFDADGDGLADVTREYTPSDAEMIGVPYSSFKEVKEPGLRIPMLFARSPSCSLGLVWVEELSRCLPSPLSVTYCDRDEVCSIATYCDQVTATCIDQFTVGDPCTEARACRSGICENELCVDRALGSACGEDADCERALECTGQQSAAPGFSPTVGALACGDAATILSPCDPALFPCTSGLSCVSIRLNGYSTCETIYSNNGSYSCESSECQALCQRLSDLGTLYACLPDES